MNRLDFLVSAFGVKLGPNGGRVFRPGVIGCLAFLALQSHPMATQRGADPQRPTFRGGVELVVVDATVLDKDGKPVPDLQVSEFSIKAGGKKRNIVSIDYIGAGALKRATSSAASASAIDTAAPPSISRQG